MPLENKKEKNSLHASLSLKILWFLWLVGHDDDDMPFHRLFDPSCKFPMYVHLQTVKIIWFVNRAQKHLSAIAAWENSKKAALEAELKKLEVILN